MYNSAIYPIKINKYTPQQKPVQNNEKEGQSNSSAKQEQQERSYNTIYRPTPGYYGNQTFGKYIAPKTQVNQPSAQPSQIQTAQNNQIRPQENKNSKQAEIMPRQHFPNGEQTAIDYSQSKINISQVIKDFQNTTEAIGSPDDVKETVYTYISLVKKESEKENPNKKIIKSNLKNASQVLDEYITDTLKKPSKVVEGWIDSLFLQNVDYKYDESIINPDYQVKFPSKNKTAENTNSETSSQENINYTQDEQANKGFINSLITAKNEQNPAEALNMYSQIISEAQKENDTKTLSIAYFESGKLYDSFNSIGKALENYESAIENSSDNGLKAQAYMKIAQIQHDCANLKDAGENYFSSIACFGEIDNTKAQAVLLTRTGKLAGEEFNKNSASDYFYVADILAKDYGDKNLIGKINQKAGETFAYMNEPKIALDYYKNSAYCYNDTDKNEELAKDYRAAAKLMLELGNPAKARTLLNKAYKAGLKTNNDEFLQQIQAEISVLS